MAIALVSRCPLRALGLQALLEAEGHPPCWIAHTAADALFRCQEHRPTLLLLDFALPDLSGPRLLHQLRLQHPALAGVVILDELHPAPLALAQRAGAQAVLWNGFPLAVLRERLRAALEGWRSWPLGALRVAQGWWACYGDPWGSLSPRQRAVALGVARGWSDKEIAQALALRPASLRTHLDRILHRLDLPDRVALRQWMRMGWLDHPLITPLLDLEDPPSLGEELTLSPHLPQKMGTDKPLMSPKNGDARRRRRR